ncbi:MAG: hypothetical protein EU530_06705 [Promethearchaeota archaeon]|nr:MAG: hypothetical protein EU530_06705 [Candidatus Lokiarchaeota archaeon]
MEYSEHKSFKTRWEQFIRLINDPKAFFRFYFIDFHLDYNLEPVRYKKDVRRGLLIAFIFATIFGIYENLWAFAIFNTPQLVWVHWILWWLTTITIAYFVT